MVSPLFFPPTSHHVTCPVCAQFVGRKVWCKNTPFPLKPPYRFFEGNVPYLFPAVMIFYFKKTKPSQTNSQIHKDTLVVVDTLKLCGCLSRAIGNAQPGLLGQPSQRLRCSMESSQECCPAPGTTYWLFRGVAYLKSPLASYNNIQVPLLSLSIILYWMKQSGVNSQMKY